MDILKELTAKSMRAGLLYVLWTTRRRITIIVGTKAERGLLRYTFTNVDKYIFPRFYRTNIEKIVLPAQKGLVSKSKFVKFDGYTFKEFSNNSDGKSYKQNKYIHDIVENVNNLDFMLDWLNKPQIRYKMQYKTLHFLAYSGMNPSMPLESAKGFSDRVKNSAINRFKKKHSQILVFENQNVVLIKDAVGLWTTDLPTKKSVLKDVDCITSYDVEHIVSNSLGVDNNDCDNAIILDSVLNRKKGNQMLFLVNDEIIHYIRKKQIEQKKFLRSLRPWYLRWF